jgi:2-keto-4-pentenoate hydratase/2-oxohepta-3-ene-1,7-dioic acid hydratase in catechol pathway
MKLVTFHSSEGGPRLGALVGEEVADLSSTGLDMMGAVRGAPATIGILSSALDKAPRRARANLRLLAPIRPGKCLCSGVNYHALVVEAGMSAPPAEPFFFAKLPSSICGPDDEVKKPARTEKMDWEVEFAVVIGRRLHMAAEDEVMPAVFGYTLLNDLSARDVQGKDNQITLGKNFENFAPIGPCIVTADEMSDLSDIQLTTHVNGIKVQDDSTRNWIFTVPQMVAFLSHVMPLEPGDIVSTGTTAGLGMFMKPPRFLVPGDVVEIAATGIGAIRTRIV